MLPADLEFKNVSLMVLSLIKTSQIQNSDIKLPPASAQICKIQLTGGTDKQVAGGSDT